MKLWLVAAGLALGLITSTTASAREFEVVAASPDGLIALQRPTKSQGDSIVAASVVLMFSQDQAISGANLAYLSTDWEFDCAKRQYRVADASGRNASGEFVIKAPNEHSDWEVASDGGIETELMNRICVETEPTAALAPQKTAPELLAWYRENAAMYDPKNIPRETTDGE